MKELLTFIIALALGFGAGYYMALPNVISDNGETVDPEDDLMLEDVAYELLDISNSVGEDTTPTVEISTADDSLNGYNIQILTKNHEFAPQNAGGEHVLGEGHAHIYVDGRYVDRVYGNWYYLEGLNEGQNTLSVRLASNDHKELALGANLIEASETIIVSSVLETVDADGGTLEDTTGGDGTDAGKTGNGESEDSEQSAE